MKNIIVKLVKIANDIDAMGMHDEADEITKIAEDIQDGDREAETGNVGMINLNTDVKQKQHSINVNQKNMVDKFKTVNTLREF